MLTAALFIAAKIGKQLRHLSEGTYTAVHSADGILFNAQKK